MPRSGTTTLAAPKSKSTRSILEVWSTLSMLKRASMERTGCATGRIPGRLTLPLAPLMSTATALTSPAPVPSSAAVPKCEVHPTQDGENRTEVGEDPGLEARNLRPRARCGCGRACRRGQGKVDRVAMAGETGIGGDGNTRVVALSSAAASGAFQLRPVFRSRIVTLARSITTESTADQRFVVGLRQQLVHQDRKLPRPARRLRATRRCA